MNKSLSEYLDLIIFSATGFPIEAETITIPQFPKSFGIGMQIIRNDVTLDSPHGIHGPLFVKSDRLDTVTNVWIHDTAITMARELVANRVAHNNVWFDPDSRLELIFLLSDPIPTTIKKYDNSKFGLLEDREKGEIFLPNTHIDAKYKFNVPLFQFKVKVIDRYLWHVMDHKLMNFLVPPFIEFMKSEWEEYPPLFVNNQNVSYDEDDGLNNLQIITSMYTINEHINNISIEVLKQRMERLVNEYIDDFDKSVFKSGDKLWQPNDADDVWLSIPLLNLSKYYSRRLSKDSLCRNVADLVSRTRDPHLVGRAVIALATMCSKANMTEVDVKYKQEFINKFISSSSSSRRFDVVDGLDEDKYFNLLENASWVAEYYRLRHDRASHTDLKFFSLLAKVTTDRLKMIKSMSDESTNMLINAFRVLSSCYKPLYASGDYLEQTSNCRRYILYLFSILMKRFDANIGLISSRSGKKNIMTTILFVLSLLHF